MELLEVKYRSKRHTADGWGGVFSYVLVIECMALIDVVVWTIEVIKLAHQKIKHAVH
jgi:hypothetical protein